MASWDLEKVSKLDFPLAALLALRLAKSRALRAELPPISAEGVEFCGVFKNRLVFAAYCRLLVGTLPPSSAGKLEVPLPLPPSSTGKLEADCLADCFLLLLDGNSASNTNCFKRSYIIYHGDRRLPSSCLSHKL